MHGILLKPVSTPPRFGGAFQRWETLRPPQHSPRSGTGPGALRAAAEPGGHKIPTSQEICVGLFRRGSPGSLRTRKGGVRFGG